VLSTPTLGDDPQVALRYAPSIASIPACLLQFAFVCEADVGEPLAAITLFAMSLAVLPAGDAVNRVQRWPCCSSEALDAL